MAKKEVEEVKPVIPDPEAGEKPPEGYSEEDWKDLSDAEKEGILSGLSGEDEEEVEDIDDETLEAIAGEEEKKPVKEEKPKVEKPKEEAKPPEKPEEKPAGEPVKEEAKPLEEEPAGEVLSDEELVRFRPHVSDAELEIKEVIPPEVQKKLDDLDTKYDQGEVSLKDYNKERDSINREIVRSQIRQQDFLRDQKVWEKEQAHFLRNRPEYLEKSIKGNALFGALGEAIKTIGADPKFSGISGIELLIEADKAVKEVFGLGKKPNTEGKKSKGKEGEEKPPAKLPDNKTLTDIPNAAKPEVGENWAAAIDSLHGEAYEDALAKMTPEQRARYEDDADRRSASRAR